MLRNATKIKTLGGPAKYLPCSYQLCKCFHNVHNGMKRIPPNRWSTKSQNGRSNL